MVSDLLCPLILVSSSRASHRPACRRCAWRSLQSLPCSDHLSCIRCWPCARHVNSPGSSLHKAPISLTRRESVVLVTERRVCLTLECGEIISVGIGAQARLLPERKGRRTRCSQDPRGILGTIAEPTGTDGLRLRCRQFYTSSNYPPLPFPASSKKSSRRWLSRLWVRRSKDQGREIFPTAYRKKSGRLCLRGLETMSHTAP